MSKYRSIGQGILCIGAVMLFTVGCSSSLKYMGKDVGMGDFQKDLIELGVDQRFLDQERGKFHFIIDQNILPLEPSEKTAKFQEDFVKYQTTIFLAKDSTLDIDPLVEDGSWHMELLALMKDLASNRAIQNRIQLVPFFVDVFRNTLFQDRDLYFKKAIGDIFQGTAYNSDGTKQCSSWNDLLPRFGSAAPAYEFYKDTLTECLYQCLTFLKEPPNDMWESAQILDLIYALDKTQNQTDRFKQIALKIQATENAPTRKYTMKHSWGLVAIQDVLKKIDDKQVSEEVINNILQLDIYQGAPFLLSRMATFKNDSVENIGMLFEAYGNVMPYTEMYYPYILGRMALSGGTLPREAVLMGIADKVNQDSRLKDALTKSAEDIKQIYVVQSAILEWMIKNGKTVANHPQNGISNQIKFTLNPLVTIINALGIRIDTSPMVAQAMAKAKAADEQEPSMLNSNDLGQIKYEMDKDARIQKFRDAVNGR